MNLVGKTQNWETVTPSDRKTQIQETKCCKLKSQQGSPGIMLCIPKCHVKTALFQLRWSLTSDERRADPRACSMELCESCLLVVPIKLVKKMQIWSFWSTICCCKKMSLQFFWGQLEKLAVTNTLPRVAKTQAANSRERLMAERPFCAMVLCPELRAVQLFSPTIFDETTPNRTETQKPGDEKTKHNFQSSKATPNILEMKQWVEELGWWRSLPKTFTQSLRLGVVPTAVQLEPRCKVELKWAMETRTNTTTNWLVDDISWYSLYICR